MTENKKNPFDELLTSNLERKFLILSIMMSIVMLKPLFITLCFMVLASTLLFQAETVRLLRYGAQELLQLILNVFNETFLKPYKYPFIGGSILTAFLTLSFWLPGFLAGIILSVVLSPVFEKLGHAIDTGKNTVDNLVNFRFMPAWVQNIFTWPLGWFGNKVEERYSMQSPDDGAGVTTAPPFEEEERDAEDEEKVFFECNTTPPERPRGIYWLLNLLSPDAADMRSLSASLDDVRVELHPIDKSKPKQTQP